jgi:hypothetical protein
MSSLYGANDPYLDFLNTDSLLFSKKPQANGKGGDSLKFSDPLSFGENDPLSFRGESSSKKPLGFETVDTESRHSEDEDCPTAPPVDYLGYVQGYEMVGYETVSIPPPPDNPPEIKEEAEEDEKDKADAEATPSLPQPAVVNLTDQQARSALLSFVSAHCCYGTGAAKQMRITSLEYVPAHHYELQTFTEKRETNWSYAPHKGIDIDSATSGRAPLPWEVDEPPMSMFKDEVRVVTVPHTGVVKTCHKCRGGGGMTCGECYGKGWVRCLHCHGDSYQTDGGGGMGRDKCYYCHHSKHGHGHMECEKCQAKGKVSCATCEGTAHIRSFIQLSISWRVVTAEHIVTKHNIPENLVRNASGQVAFEEEQPKVFPVDAFKDEVIKMASAQLVASHASKFPDEKILRQRHQVRVVPVTKVNYEWKGRSRSFHVYGYENKVHMPDNSSYPQAYCWGCCVM